MLEIKEEPRPLIELIKKEDDCEEKKDPQTIMNHQKAKLTKEIQPVVNLERLSSLRMRNELPIRMQEIEKMNIFKFTEANIVLSSKRKRKCRKDNLFESTTLPASDNTLKNSVRDEKRKKLLSKPNIQPKESKSLSPNCLANFKRISHPVVIKNSQVLQKEKSKAPSVTVNGTCQSKLSKLSSHKKSNGVGRANVKASKMLNWFKYEELSVKQFDGYIQIMICPRKNHRYSYNPLDKVNDSSSKVTKLCQPTPVWYNSLSPTALDELAIAFEHAQKSEACRCVLLTSVGSTFSTGLDLRYLTYYAAQCDKESLQQSVESIRKLVDCLLHFPKPIVAAVQGRAVGFAASLLFLSDVVLMDENATIQYAYPQQGLTPLACTTFFLPHICKPAMSNSLLYGHRILTSKEAENLGIASEVFPHDLFMRSVIPRVRDVAAASLVSLTATKRLVRSRHMSQLVYANECECRALRQCLSNPASLRTMESYLKIYFS